MKAETEVLEARKAALARDDIAVEPSLPSLHPGLAGIYRRKIEELTAVLTDDLLRDRDASFADWRDPAGAGERRIVDRTIDRAYRRV